MRAIRPRLLEARGVTCKSFDPARMFASWESISSTFLSHNQPVTASARTITLQWLAVHRLSQEFVARIPAITSMSTSAATILWPSPLQLQDLSRTTDAGISTSNKSAAILLQKVFSSFPVFVFDSHLESSTAPIGCLQYWMDPAGWVSSFNYASAASGLANLIGVQGSRQIANLQYGACVRPAAGQCGITWSIVRNLSVVELWILIETFSCLAHRWSVRFHSDRRCWRDWSDDFGNGGRSRPKLHHWLGDDSWRLSKCKTCSRWRSFLRSWHRHNNEQRSALRHLLSHKRQRDPRHR